MSGAARRRIVNTDASARTALLSATAQGNGASTARAAPRSSSIAATHRGAPAVVKASRGVADAGRRATRRSHCERYRARYTPMAKLVCGARIIVVGEVGLSRMQTLR